MRIGIDCTAAVNQGAGIGRYTRQLVQALLELDTQNQYVLLMAAGTPPLGLRPPGRTASRCDGSGTRTAQTGIHSLNAQQIHLPMSERLLTIVWHRLHLPLWVELLSGGLDIFHSPDFALPPVRRARTVLTVHDLSFMRVPECSQPSLLAYLLRVVPASVRRADVVLADSESTRNDVIELLGVEPERVHVIYPGVEGCFERVQDMDVLATVRRRYDLPERFVLSLGTLQPRKNFERLIEAYAQVRAGRYSVPPLAGRYSVPPLAGRYSVPPLGGSGIDLVIAGGTGWMYDGIFRRVEELRLQDVVHFPGYVADADLPALYTLADLFVFPSLYEGFGLPPLEAMACGTAVVTSNVSSLPEVVGDAALMVDPRDVGALAVAMGRMLGDAALRDAMVQRGLVQARQFTWSLAAEKLLQIYRATA